MVATATMLYALHWGPVALTPAEQALQSCTTGSSSCYNSQVQNSFGQGGCIEFPSSLNGGEPGRGSRNGQNCMAWQNTSLSFLAVSFPIARIPVRNVGLTFPNSIADVRPAADQHHSVVRPS